VIETTLAKERPLRQLTALLVALGLSLAALSSPRHVLAQESMPAEAPEPAPTEHVVQRGEYLAAIAYRYGVTVEQMAAANNIANPRLIHAGVRLRIPAPGEALPPPPADNTPAPATETPQETVATSAYVVVRGDYLSAIASRFGVTTAELISLNSLANPSLIHAGMVLTLPPGAASTVAADSRPEPTISDGKQIIVVLSQQKVYAYENGELVQEVLASTGLPATPTVQGDFAVYLHVPSQLMRGSDYYLPDVQWALYFYRDYALHGTYWHTNFGVPMSHGCVNLRNEDAEWLYNWAPDGTSVRVIQ